MEYRTDFSRSAAELSSKGAAASGQLTLGYIETRLGASLSAGGNGLVHPVTRRFCVRPHVEIRLAFSPTTLYVAREQPQGSCEFQIVMDHELRHFREYERFLHQLSGDLEKELAGLFGGRVQHFDSQAAGDSALNNTLSGFLKPRMERAQTEIAARQARHDTPEEYFRLDRFREACAAR